MLRDENTYYAVVLTVIVTGALLFTLTIKGCVMQDQEHTFTIQKFAAENGCNYLGHGNDILLCNGKVMLESDISK